MKTTKSTVPSIKGGPVIQLLRWWERSPHASARAAVLARVAPAHRALFDAQREHFGLLETGWYPSHAIGELGEQLYAHDRPDALERFTRDAARGSIAASSKGVYAALFRMLAGPSTYARFGANSWSQAHDTGSRTLTMLDAHTLESRVLNWAGHHRFLCHLSGETMGAILIQLGCRDLELERTRCVAQGATECAVLARWR